MSTPGQDHRRIARRAVPVGMLCGLAWAAAFRGYMAEIAGIPRFDGAGTLLGVLLPGVIVGGLLGWAWARGRSGRTDRIALFALAPLAFAVAPLLLPGALLALLTQGLGSGAIGVALAAIAGGYALGGSGSRWVRVVLGLVAGAAVVGIALLPAAMDDARLALSEPRGIWVALLGGSLIAVLIVASSIPFRIRTRAAAAVEAETERRTAELR